MLDVLLWRIYWNQRAQKYRYVHIDVQKLVAAHIIIDIPEQNKLMKLVQLIFSLCMRNQLPTKIESVVI